MKKILIIAAAALFAGSVANAQDVAKQTGGEQNFEVLFKPLGGSPIGINGIKYRQFTSATSAIRASVFLGYGSTTDIMTMGDKDYKTVNSNFDISIQPGIEQHFMGTDRLSPYVGAEAVIGFNSTTKKEDQNKPGGDKIVALKDTKGNFNVGVNAFAGMDFYFADNIYLGAEFGFGILFSKGLTQKSEYFDANGDVAVNEAKGGSSFNIGPNAVGAIRLGFLF